MSKSISLIRLAGPFTTVLVAAIALVVLHQGGDTTLVVDADALGPASWPRVMLLGLLVSGILWGLARGISIQDAEPNPDLVSGKDNSKLICGAVAVVLYGVAMVYIGFALATFLFLVTWFLLGGMGRMLPAVTYSFLGTLATLYLFLKVAYLPLPRGIGFMDTLTVNLYHLLRIY